MMMRKLFPLLLVTVLLTTFCLVPMSSCDSTEEYTIEGVYYLYEEERDELNDSVWMQLKDGEWNSSEGLTGTYDITGENIAMYTIKDEEPQDYADGTVSGGELEFILGGVTLVYVRE